MRQSVFTDVQTAISYDTIKYIYVRWKADEMASLIYRMAQKRKKLVITENKNRAAQKKRPG